MKLKLLISFILIKISYFNILSAQTLNDAIKLTSNEQFESAEVLFKNLLNQEPNNGEIYFYLGENYFKNDNFDLALKMYNKGIEVNASNPLCYIGLGKIQWQQKNETEARTTLYKAIGLNRTKNINVFLKLAEVYIFSENKDIAEALKLLTLAEKIEPKNAEIFILRGDAYLESGELDASTAIKNYEQAENLDKTSTIAILRQGKLYSRAKNYNLALDYYKKASLLDSGFAPAYREKAEIYFRAGQYNNAVEQYKKYLSLNNNCSARGRYAGFLNQAGKHKEAVEEAINALKCDSSNVYLYRYKGRSEFEIGDYKNAHLSFSTFFDLTTKNNKIKVIAEDYEYLAKIYSKTGNDSLAIINYNNALKVDSTKTEIKRDIGNLYLKSKKYDKAIAQFNANLNSGKINANDYVGLGRAYYYSKNFNNADSAFKKLTELYPTMPLGYIWRARTNAQLDPKNETWQAKPFYENFVNFVKPEDTEKNRKDLIEAHTYLGVYLMNQKDYCAAKKHFIVINNLDPQNANANKFIESAEAKKCE